MAKAPKQSATAPEAPTVPTAPQAPETPTVPAPPAPPETPPAPPEAPKTTTTGATMPKTTARNTVYVYANLPHGQRFRLPGGVEVRLQGYPVSKLRDENGTPLPAGQYGITEVGADAWAEVERVYGKLAVMQSGVIFAAPSREVGDAIAAERAGLRHGLEPVDPTKTATKPAKEGAE